MSLSFALMRYTIVDACNQDVSFWDGFGPRSKPKGVYLWELTKARKPRVISGRSPGSNCHMAPVPRLKITICDPIISGGFSRWPLNGPDHPLFFRRNSCLASQWNLFHMFQKEKRQLLSKFMRFIYSYMWLMMISTGSSKISLLKKSSYVKNPLLIDLTMAETFWLGDFKTGDYCCDQYGCRLPCGTSLSKPK